VNFLARINYVIQLYFDVLRQAWSGRIWTPLVLYMALQWLVLYAHFQFTHPAFYGLIAFWTNLVGPEYAAAFSHYPQHFTLLGYYTGWAKTLVGFPLEGLILGIVARRFYVRFAGTEPQKSLSIGKWLNLILVWTVITVLIMAAGQILPAVLGQMIFSPKRMLAFSFLIAPGLYALVVSLFYLAIPLVAIGDMNFLTAIRRSLKAFVHLPITSFALAAVSLSGPLLMGALTSQPGRIVQGFKPELVYWLLAATLVVETVAYFFWMGTAVRHYLQTAD
jgi:hypothetical protein